MDKNAIKKFAVWARTELRDRVTKKIDEYAISADADPNADAVRGKLLTKDEKEQRAKLIAKVKEKGMDQVVEEGAYTWFNRFSALRFMEVNNYLPTRVRVFTDSEGTFHPQILTEAIHLELKGLDMDKVYALKEADDKDALFKYLIITQCNALSDVLPGMFQKIADYTELLFPDNLLREGSVVEQMISLIPEEDWKDQIQIVGWLYQYYITEQNEFVYDGSYAKNKIPKELVPAATTIYTPDWPVRYMVENSLGRLWAEGHPNTEIKSEWKYYLEETNQEPDVQKQLDEVRKGYVTLKPEEIRVIDPCSGSGHILAYMFDVLVQIYGDYGIPARDAVRSIIENNLWGLDIDERAVQLAYFSVMMKGVQYDRRFLRRSDEKRNPDIPQPHIYAIRESNHLDNYVVEQFVGGNAGLKKDMGTLIAELHDAKEFGSILNVSQVNFEGLYKRFAECKTEISMYQNAIEQDLYPFVLVAQTLAQKYDVVVTNPPYLGSSRFSPKLDKYIKDNYSEVKSDLSMVMYKHALDSFVKKNGFVAFITTSSWMFLASFEQLRSQLLNTCSLSSLVDYGTELFDGKVGHNPIVSWVTRAHRLDYITTAIRLVEFCYSRRAEKEPEFFNRNNRYYSHQSNFLKMPGYPISYWASEHTADLFANGTKLGDIIDARIGMVSGDNARFLRFWNEIDFNKIEFNARPNNDSAKLKWYPLQKGGDFRHWYGNLQYVINWDNEGYEIKNDNFMGTRVRSHNYNGTQQFKEGITWNSITSSKFSCRYSPLGFTYDAAGPLCEVKDRKNLYIVLGMLTSKVADYYFSLINPTMNFPSGYLESLPFVDTDRTEIDRMVEECILASKADWDASEMSWDFKKSPLVRPVRLIADAFKQWEEECDKRFTTIRENEIALNRIFIHAYGLEHELTPDIDEKDVTVKRADVKRDVRDFISYAVGCMFGRYSLDKDGIIYAGGVWNNSKYKTFYADEDGIIPICDDEYFDDDITGRFIRFVETIYGKDTLEENLRFIAGALGSGSSSRDIIRSYFLNSFYSDHCSTYSVANAGKRPIYWLFDSGKKNGFKCLIYMHRYQPDTIARIRTDYVHEQQARYRTAIAGLERQIADAPTSERVRLNKQLTKLKDQAEEVRVYEEKIHHLADQMISIDLDDGVKHNYEIFQDVLAKIK